MSVSLAITLAALYVSACWILRWLPRAGMQSAESGQTPTVAVPESCFLVDPHDIEPPHTPRITAEELKQRYVQAEAEMVSNHAAALAPRIQKQMAECLVQGWPLDVAICQATYSYFRGPCRCSTCRKFTQPTQ